MAYRVVLSDDAAAFIAGLPKKVQRQIVNHLDMLKQDPFSHKLLRLHPYRSLRSGDYRVLYQVDRKQALVNVAVIRNRRDVYDDL